MVAVFIKLCLAEPDRERYGCEEWLTVDYATVTAWEAALMQRGFTREGMTVAFESPAMWRRALTGEPVTGENGEPITEPTVGKDGEILLVPRRRIDFGAEIMLVWLALRRAGIAVPMGEVDFDRDALRWDVEADLPPVPEDEPEPGESEGKDGDGLPVELSSLPTSPD